MRVLVIDDSRAMRKLLSSILMSLGHQVVEAADGLEGLDRLERKGPFALALVDWNMPQINGYEFVRRVRADARYSKMKLMMVTTDVETAQVAKALEAGANEYVMKPFTQDALKQKLDLLQAA